MQSTLPPLDPLTVSLHLPSSAWDEIHDVFGDGHEYDWALTADDDLDYDEEQLKPEMKYQDVRINISTYCCSIPDPFSRSSNLPRFGSGYSRRTTI